MIIEQRDHNLQVLESTPSVKCRYQYCDPVHVLARTVYSVLKSNDSIVINQCENFASTRYNPFLRATTTTHHHPPPTTTTQNERFLNEKYFQQPIRITYSI